DKLLAEAGMVSLRHRTEKLSLVSVFNAVRGKAPLYISDMFRWKSPPIIRARTRTAAKLFEDWDPYMYLLNCPVASLNGYKGSLRFYGPQLWNNLSLKQPTRAVFTDVTLYSPDSNLFSIVTLLVEFTALGAGFPRWEVHTARLYRFHGAWDVWMALVYISALAIFTLVFVIREVRKAYNSGTLYLMDFWNWVEVIIILQSLAAVATFFYSEAVLEDAAGDDVTGLAGHYVNYRRAAFWDQVYTCVIAALLCSVTLKMTHLLRFSHRASLLTHTLRLSVRPLSGFSVMFFLYFFAFAILMHLTFGLRMRSYSSFARTFEALVTIIAVTEAAAPRTTGVFRQGKITYGGMGSEPGKFLGPCSIVVSSGNEIFVADTGNRRVQIHTTEGVYLRNFPTVVPGTEDKDMRPYDVSMDGNGTLWVVGSGESADHVVQYSTDGTAMTQFHLQKSSEYRGIAVDMRNNHILVTDAERGEVEVFRTDGSLVRKFGHPGGEMSRPGNILVSDWNTNYVYMYDESGKFVLKFGGQGSGEGQLRFPRGICTDRLGHIIVADRENKRVQMFTRHGEYVRTFETGLEPEGVAVGQEGQLKRRGGPVTLPCPGAPTGWSSSGCGAGDGDGDAPLLPKSSSRGRSPGRAGRPGGVSRERGVSLRWRDGREGRSTGSAAGTGKGDPVRRGLLLPISED
ncbi:hypothetical protein Bbelb_028310, partial [Branchiostoma belcheri]